MATKKIISDQVLTKLAGGYADGSFPIDERDIWKALEQKINALFKLRHFDTTLASGETIPDNAMIAVYENVTVTSFNEKSKATLPVNPISLPKNMGIFLIYDPAHPDRPFVPIQRGQGSLLLVDKLLNDLNGRLWYEPRNKDVIFSKDITTLNVDAVTMELCVFEMSQYSSTDILPVPSDFEQILVAELVKEFSPVTAEDGTVNVWTAANQNVIKQ